MAGGPKVAAPKTSESMLAKYRRLTARQRMVEAIKLVMNDGVSQAQAARDCGVSREQLNRRCRVERERRAQLEGRSEAAKQDRAQRQADYMGEVPANPPASLLKGAPAAPKPVLGPVNEVRRVPPVDVFYRKYFSQFPCLDCGVHHEVPAFHDEMMALAVDPEVKRLLVNVPPFHAKSHSITTMTTLYEIVRDPNSQHAIVSKASDLAMTFVQQIANLLTDPEAYGDGPNLIDDWGPFNDGSPGWTQKGFYVAGRKSIERDPTLSAYGILTQIFGRRFNRIVCDDIADVDNQINPDTVEKMRRKITQEFNSRVGKNGKLIVVGTRVAPNDIYSLLLPLKAYRQLRYPAVLDEHLQTTLWPEHQGWDAIQLFRDEMTPEQFELVYQNSDLANVGGSFQPEHLERCHDGERGLGNVPPNCDLVVGIDPAGAGAQAGFTAMVLLGLDRASSMRYLIDLVNVKAMKAYQLKDQILDWADRYRLREIRVEANGIQGNLVQYNNDLLRPLTERGVRVSGHITHGKSGRGGKWDPDFGVETMGPMFHNGQISIPWMGVETRRRVAELEKQLLQFPAEGAVNDLVMALWIAELGCRDLALTRKAVPYDPRTTSKWPKRIRNRRRIVSFADGIRTPSLEEEGVYTPLSQLQGDLQPVNVRR